MDPVLSVVMPVYNEAATIAKAIETVLGQPLVAELVIVNDGSNDGTSELLTSLQSSDSRIVLQRHETNRGKGAAVRTGVGVAHAPFILIQDADLEYDPAEYPKLLQPLVDGRADVVFGSRFVGSEPHRVLYFWHFVGHRFLTMLSNALTNLNLTDIESGLKAFKREIIEKIEIKEQRFGIEPELTAKVARLGVRVYEVAISYNGRTYQEGKKVTWQDGLDAVRCILQYNLWDRS